MSGRGRPASTESCTSPLNPQFLRVEGRVPRTRREGDQETLYETVTTDPLTTDSAACMKKVLIRTWQRNQSDLRNVNHPL